MTNSGKQSRFVLLRHGLSEANRDDILQGQSDYPLAEEGETQTKALIQLWQSQRQNYRQIISSPLLRARATAELLSDALGIDLVFDEIWKERHHGEAQGISYEQVRERYAHRPLASPFEPFFDSGESEWDLHIRATGAIKKLIQLEPDSYLIVSHGGFLGAVLRAVLGIAPSHGRLRPIQFSFANTGFAELRFDHDEARWYIDSLNSTTHLQTAPHEHKTNG